MRKPVLVSAAVMLLMAMMTLPAASAAQQNEIVLSVDFDGTETFSTADPMDDGLGAHTPGLDLNANNNVVRTNDQIQYRIDWNVNEEDGTTTTVRMTLPEGVRWLEDASTVTGVPSGCADDGTSSITGNDGRDLVCVTDSEHEGSNGAIHPRAQVGALLDNDKLLVEATVETDQAAPVTSNQIETTVSATPRADWVKGKEIVDADSGDIIAYEPDEMYWDVMGTDGSTPGRLFVWNLRLLPVGSLKGAEPLNDAVPIQFFDQFFDSVPGTALATPAQMLAATGTNRVPCGGYDGADGYPFGVTAGVASTTPANQTAVGTWECTDVTSTTGHGYPVVDIEITGQDTTNLAEFNANLSPNSSAMTSGQIAFWAPEDNLIAKPVPRIIVNAITGSDDVIAQGTAEVPPIEIAATSGTVPELSEPGNGLAGVSNNSPYEFPTSPPSSPPGRSFRHFVKYYNAPYAEVENTDWFGKTYRSLDHRRVSVGGPGYGITDGANGVDGGNFNRWDGDGQTPRGNTLVVHSTVSAQHSSPPSTPYFEPIHLCTAIDTTHQALIEMPSTFTVTDVGDGYTGPHAEESTFEYDRPAVGGYSDSPASPLAQVLTGVEGVATTQEWPRYSMGPVTNRAELDYVIEFAAAGSPGNAVSLHDVTCNGDDADGRGWVDGTDAQALEDAFDPDGDGIYEDVSHVRVRTLGDVPWQGNNPGTTSYGARLQLNFQVMVKDDAVAQAADQELFVYSSRSSGAWDGTGQPPTPNCTNPSVFSPYSANDISQTFGIPEGWCNLPYTDDAAITGGDSTVITDFKNDYDSTAVELVDFLARPRAAHADSVYIVEPALAISKVNLDGPSDIVANGGTAVFEINPKVVGSSLDEIDNVIVTDTLPSTMIFNSFISQPAGDPCTVSGQTITCDYGDDKPGGWGNAGEGKFSFEVTITDAPADATLTNTATVTGDDSQTAEPKTPASSSAQAFTGAPYEESGIIKAVDAHLGDCFEAPGDAADPGDCTIISTDGGMKFELTVKNEGNVDLADYRVIDVLPHLADGVSEPSSATGVIGDARTPASAFPVDTLDFVSAAGPGATLYYSADDPATISRDADEADVNTTWCAAFGGAPVATGPAGVAGTNPCPADATEVTAVYWDLGTLTKGETRLLELALTTDGADCGNIWTNTFGARTTGLRLPIRSNDVSVMSAFCDASIDIEKSTNGSDSDEAPGGQIVAGDPVTWTYDVTNDGDSPLINAEVSDVPAPTGGIVCDLNDNDDFTDDGAGANPFVIPVMLPDDVITCQAEGVAIDGAFSNNATVTGTPAFPDFSDPGIDPADPETWPTDAEDYTEAIDPVTGDPVDDVDDEDPSHYTGVPLPDVEIDIEKTTNGSQSDEAPGAPIVAGAAVTWTYVISNPGDGALVDAEVTDTDGDGSELVVVCDLDGDGDFTNDGADSHIIPLLVPGGDVTCQSTGVAGVGDYSNNATVSGTLALPNESCECDPADAGTWPTDPDAYTVYVDPDSGESVAANDEDPSHYTGFEAGVDIEKTTNDNQADDDLGDPIAEGSPVRWNYTIENTGATALANVIVADSDPAVLISCDLNGDEDFTNDDPAANPFVIALMLPGDVIICEAEGLAGTENYENIGTVVGEPVLPDFAADPDSGEPACGCDPNDPATWPTDPTTYLAPIDENGEPLAPANDMDASHYQGVPNNFDLSLTKELAEGTASLVQLGSEVTFVLTVTNEGEVEAINVEVVDNLPAGMTLADPDWTAGAGNSVSYLLAGPLAPGASEQIEITVEVTDAGDLNNNAEITAATPSINGVGLPDDVVSELGDIDSTPANNSGGGEDDEDSAVISVVTPVSPSQSSVPVKKLALTGNESVLFVGFGGLAVLLGVVVLMARRQFTTISN